MSELQEDGSGGRVECFVSNSLVVGWASEVGQREVGGRACDWMGG